MYERLEVLVQMEKVSLVLKRTEKFSFEPPAPGTDEWFALLNVLNL